MYGKQWFVSASTRGSEHWATKSAPTNQLNREARQPLRAGDGGEKEQKIWNTRDHQYSEETQTPNRAKPCKPKFAGGKRTTGKQQRGARRWIARCLGPHTNSGEEHPQVPLRATMGCSALQKAGLEATGMDRERPEGEARPRGRQKHCQTWLFALKTFKILTARAMLHVSALAKTRMTSNQIKDTLSKVWLSSQELKIILNCMKVSTQDLGDQMDAPWNQQTVLHRSELQIIKACILFLRGNSRNRNRTEKWLPAFCSNPNTNFYRANVSCY